MRYTDLVVYIPIRAQGLSKGDKDPTNTPHEVWYSTFTIQADTQCSECLAKQVPHHKFRGSTSLQ